MALFDNRHWLLSHIRNSFISSDDTGMCEAVIVENIPREFKHFNDHERFPDADDSSDDEDGVNNSLDMHTDSDFGGHRMRTNTAQRLAKLELEMQKAAQVKHIKWENLQPTLSAEDREELFPRKAVTPVSKDLRSLLTYELQKCPSLPRNPFAEYAKFDGGAQVSMATRTYRVFMDMLPPADRNYPITVCVLASAKVSELIGFVLWKYTAENADSNVKFLEDITRYGLFIAEDDGEVDWDFSCLDPKETVGKFGLAYLALVELSEKNMPKETKPDEEEMKYARQDETDGVKNMATADDIDQIQGYLTAIEALVYQTFRVQLLQNKLLSRTPVVLGISGDRVEVDPVQTGSASGTNAAKAFFKSSRIQHASYDVADVVACTMEDARPTRSRMGCFRIVRRSVRGKEKDVARSSGAVENVVGDCDYHQRSATFKSMDFEAEFPVAEEIVRKLNCILRLKASVHRKEYLKARERKTTRRRSFSIWPR